MVEVEGGGGPAAEVVVGELGDGALEGAEGVGFADAGEGEVGLEGAGVGFETEGGESLGGGAGELGEFFAALDGDIEDAGVVGVGEPADAAEGDFEGRGRGDGGEGGFEVGEAVFGPFADEAGGDVEVVEGAPGEAGVGFEQLEEEFEVAPHLVGDVKTGEEAHGTWYSHIA